MSPDYFFSMSFFEATVYLEGLREKEKSELEKVRLIMWASLVPHSKQSLELDDVLKLEAEKEVNDKEDMDALRERAKMMEGIINGKHIY